VTGLHTARYLLLGALLLFVVFAALAGRSPE
jgi:hypothetical protein